MGQVVKFEIPKKDGVYTKDDVRKFFDSLVDAMDDDETIVSYGCFLSTDKRIYNKAQANRYLELMGALEVIKQDMLAENIFHALGE